MENKRETKTTSGWEIKRKSRRVKKKKTKTADAVVAHAMEVLVLVGSLTATHVTSIERRTKG
jgi:3-methyladenine DNA glycosylase AlkC